MFKDARDHRPSQKVGSYMIRAARAHELVTTSGMRRHGRSGVRVTDRRRRLVLLQVGAFVEGKHAKGDAAGQLPGKDPQLVHVIIIANACALRSDEGEQ